MIMKNRVQTILENTLGPRLQAVMKSINCDQQRVNQSRTTLMCKLTRFIYYRWPQHLTSSGLTKGEIVSELCQCLCVDTDLSPPSDRRTSANQCLHVQTHLLRHACQLSRYQCMYTKQILLSVFSFFLSFSQNITNSASSKKIDLPHPLSDRRTSANQCLHLQTHLRQACQLSKYQCVYIKQMPLFVFVFVFSKKLQAIHQARELTFHHPLSDR